MIINILEVSNECYTILGILFFIRELLKVLLFLVPIVVLLILGLDILKLITSNNLDNSGKTLNKSTKRLINMLIIFLIPNLVFSIFNLTGLEVNDSFSCWTYINETSVEKLKNVIEQQEKARQTLIAKEQESRMDKENVIAEELNTQYNYSDTIPNNNESSTTKTEGKNKYRVRLTHFSDNHLGAGLYKSSDGVSTNSHGWYQYTYNGKTYLVIATATYELKNSSSYWHGYSPKLMFNYWDIVQLDIDGTIYDAIVLDSCGACMKASSDKIIIDLWISSSGDDYGDYQDMYV